MKKMMLLVGLFFINNNANAQNAQKIGIQANVYAGAPVGFTHNESNINVGASVGYLGYINKIMKVGGSIGYDYTDVKSDAKLYDCRTFEYFMIGGTAEVDVIKNFYIGADLGYAFQVHEKSIGSHYFTPKVGYRISDLMNVYAHYKAVRYTGYQVASVGVGLGFEF